MMPTSNAYNIHQCHQLNDSGPPKRSSSDHPNTKRRWSEATDDSTPTSSRSTTLHTDADTSRTTTTTTTMSHDNNDNRTTNGTNNRIHNKDINTTSSSTSDDTIGPNDVLLGRGGATNNHIGNRRFRTLVAQYRTEYLQARKRNKVLIARHIVSIIQHERQGRFLQRSGDNNLWQVVPPARAQAKTSQALREGLDVRNQTVRPEKIPRHVLESQYTTTSTTSPTSNAGVLVNPAATTCAISTTNYSAPAYPMNQGGYAASNNNHHNKYANSESDDSSSVSWNSANAASTSRGVVVVAQELPAAAQLPPPLKRPRRNNPSRLVAGKVVLPPPQQQQPNRNQSLPSVVSPTIVSAFGTRRNSTPPSSTTTTLRKGRRMETIVLPRNLQLPTLERYNSNDDESDHANTNTTTTPVDQVQFLQYYQPPPTKVDPDAAFPI